MPHLLPDPIPGLDNHYMSFSEVYEMKITEQYCPSLQNKKSQNIPIMSAQFGKNVWTVIKCVKCNKPRVLYACRKLSEEEYLLLQSFLETVEYICGISFKGLTELSFSKSICNDTDEKENEVISHEQETDSIAELFKLDIIQIGNELPFCEECHTKTGEKRKMER
ncbi:954_t:CDS:2, partial [Funneliformis geosporum]